MKHLIFLIIVFSICLNTNIFGQYKAKKEVKYFTRDQLFIDITYNHFIEAPEYLDQKWNSFGSNIFIMYNLLGKHSNIGLATGFGISFANFASNTYIDETNPTTIFSVIPDTLNYQKSQISTTYIDLPVEIRLRTNPNEKKKSVKFYLGFKLGYLLNNKTKYKGDDFVTGKHTKIRKYDLPNINPFRYGPYFRIGYSKLTVTGYYALYELFDKNKAPKIAPISLGISIIIF